VAKITDAVARFVQLHFGERCFVGSRPGTTINLWKTWDYPEQGWFLSRRASTNPHPREKDLMNFLANALSGFESKSISWRLLLYEGIGAGDEIRKMRLTFMDIDGKPSPQSPIERNFHDPALVDWLKQHLGYPRIFHGRASKPTRRGRVFDAFHLWDNQNVRGWRITDVDVLLFSDSNWAKPKAVLEIKRTTERNWIPRSNDPHDLLWLFARAQGVPYFVVKHGLDPSKGITQEASEGLEITVVTLEADEPCYDFEKLLGSLKNTTLGEFIEQLENLP